MCVAALVAVSVAVFVCVFVSACAVGRVSRTAPTRGCAGREMAQDLMARGHFGTYSMRQRDRAMIANGRSVKERAASIGASTRSIQRWDRRLKLTGNYEPNEGGRWRRGRQRKLSADGVLALFWLKVNFPEASSEECRLWVWNAVQIDMSAVNISMELKLMGLTRKRMRYVSKNRNETQRVNYWTQGPFAGNAAMIMPGVHGERNFAGVSGLDVGEMIDIDEASYYVNQSERRYGHALAGYGAVGVGHGPRTGKKWTILLACDVNVGTVAYWRYEGNTTKERFYLFLALFVFPAIVGPRRYILFDNLSGHFGPEIDQLFQLAGHTWIARPIHSPDFGFVEWCFNWIRMFLEHHHPEIEEGNFEQYLDAAKDAIQPEHVQGFAADAHYFVEGRDYHPYGVDL